MNLHPTRGFDNHPAANRHIEVVPLAAAMGAELLLGVVLLMGTVWLATHLAVRIFGPKESAS